jgi:hypothetical protein
VYLLGEAAAQVQGASGCRAREVNPAIAGRTGNPAMPLATRERVFATA